METGYYWIRFPGRDHWEPGGYDAKVQMFMLIGSTDPWYPWQLTVGDRIDPPKGRNFG